MSFVSSYIGGISATQFGGENKVSVNFDMDNSVFEELLLKQMETKPSEAQNFIMDSLGMPPGLDIEVLDIPTNDNFDSAIKPVEQTLDANLADKKEISSSEYSNLFNSFLGKGTDFINQKADLLDFAKRNATTIYSKCSGNVVTGLGEFISDALHLS